MGDIKVHPPVKMICAVTFQRDFPLETALKELEKLISRVQQKSEIFEFDFTTYYEPEMGSGLLKQMLGFEGLFPVEILPDIKVATNELELKLSRQAARKINLDPGYLTAAKLVLATTKDYDHRLYLGRGIFGDVHLRFRQKHFLPNEWTYPDYRQPEILRFFEEVRAQYMQELAEFAAK
ncbi:MAG: DUF4416 family protein [Calditrichia bacterium]